MFEEFAKGEDLAHVDDAVLVDAITGWTRAEATVAFHRMAAIAELADRRLGSEQSRERALWACDGWDSAAAEVSVACGISQRKASTAMHQSMALRNRLPGIAALVEQGTLPARLANVISWRTQLIDDPDVLTRVDGDLADVAASFGALSETKVENAIDAAITRHDPAAVPRFKEAAKGCDVVFGSRDDATGTRSIWGRLTVTDAELFERRLGQLVGGVCRQDPRSGGERRTAAIGVIGAGGTDLPCECGRSDCPAAGPDARADAIVIHVLTDRLPDEGPDAGPPLEPGPDPDPGPPQDPESDVDAEPPARGMEAPGPSAPGPRTESRCSASGLAVIAGGGIVPTPLLSQLVTLGAMVRPVASAGDLCAEAHYRPSTKLQRFVRSRDLTCCFPNCDRPAERCDVDHTTAHGLGGLTHPGNTKCVCRKHHLLKTYWTGAGGWSDQQLSDGTIVWMSPTGHRYTRPPGSRLIFPRWDTTTPLPAGTCASPATGSPERGLKMPARRTSRGYERALRVHAARQRNQRAIDEDQAPY